jgi:hypothetical protein
VIRQNIYKNIIIKSIAITSVFLTMIFGVPITAFSQNNVVGLSDRCLEPGDPTPYGGQVIVAMPALCSAGILFMVHEYARSQTSPLVCPVYFGLKTDMDKTEVVDGETVVNSEYQDLFSSEGIDLSKIMPIGTYYTPQNVAALFMPGHYQLGHLSGKTEADLGVPPYCGELTYEAANIHSFGNGGWSAAATINPLAWVALGATAALVGWQMLTAEGDDGTAEGSPGCGAELTDLWFEGNGGATTMLHVRTPGRTSWPQKTEGGGGIVYEYQWSGDVSGTGPMLTTNFPNTGIKRARVTVRDPKKNTLTRDCPPVIVAEQAPLVDPESDDLNVTCTVNKTVASVNERLTYGLEAFGGSGEYEYKWNGDISSATTTYEESSSSYTTTYGGTNSVTTSFASQGTKIVSVTLTDKVSGEKAIRYCSPVVIENEPEVLMCGKQYLNLKCSVDKRSVRPGETLNYMADGTGGEPEPVVVVNAELRINGHRVDWFRPCQDWKRMDNMFNGYWGGTRPQPGEMMQISIRSIDGRYELKGEAPWPPPSGVHGSPTHDSCTGSGGPSDGGLGCDGAPPIPVMSPVPCPDISGILPVTTGLEPVAPGSTNLSFVEKNGIISMEAENFKSQVGYSVVGDSQASGGKVMQAGGGGSLNFEFDVTTPGKWYVWIRTFATTSEDNGMYLRVNNSDLRHSSGINDIYLEKGAWSWTPEWLFGESDHKGPITANFTSGTNTLSITKRKIERPLIDKIVLTRSNQPPAGFGPAETTTTSGTTINTDPVNPIPVTDPVAVDFAAVTGHKASFLFDDASTRVMNILSPRASNSKFQQVINKTKANGDNSIYLYLINGGDGENSPQSFYVNDQIGGQIDSSKLSIYKQRLNYIKSLGYKIIFWIRADDSNEMMRQSVVNYKKYHQDIIDNFGSYASGYVIGLESNEYLDAGTEKTLVADMKTRTNKTVGVHYGTSDRYNSRAKASGADIYYRQYGWVSCSKVASITKSTISAVSPMKVVASEYDRDSDSGCGAAAIQAGAIGYGNG